MGIDFVFAVLAGVVLDAVEVGIGFEYLAGSAAGGTVFGYCSRSLPKIFDDSGDTGVLTLGFVGGRGGVCDVVEP